MQLLPRWVPGGARGLQGKFRERPVLYIILSWYEGQPKPSKTILKLLLNLWKRTGFCTDICKPKKSMQVYLPIKNTSHFQIGRGSCWGGVTPTFYETYGRFHHKIKVISGKVSWKTEGDSGLSFAKSAEGGLAFNQYRWLWLHNCGLSYWWSVSPFSGSYNYVEPQPLSSARTSST